MFSPWQLTRPTRFTRCQETHSFCKHLLSLYGLYFVPVWGAVAWWWVGPNPPQALQFWVTAWIGWVKCTMVHCPSPMQYGSLPLMLFWVWVTASHAILGHCLPCYSGSLPVRKTSLVTAALLSQPINPQTWMEFWFSSSTYLKNKSTFVCSALGDSKSYVSLRLSSKGLDTHPTTLKLCKEVKFTQWAGIWTGKA